MLQPRRCVLFFLLFCFFVCVFLSLFWLRAAAGMTAGEHKESCGGGGGDRVQYRLRPTGGAAQRQKRAEERRPGAPSLTTGETTGDKSLFYCLKARENPPETLNLIKKKTFLCQNGG